MCCLLNAFNTQFTQFGLGCLMQPGRLNPIN